MNPYDLLTKRDLMDFEKRMKEYLSESIESQISVKEPEEEYLRTREVKKLLKVSDNTLKSMRESGSLPFTFINKTMYYSKATIQKLLKDNMINNLKTK